MSVRSGLDPTGFLELYDRSSAELFAFCYRQTLSREIAADLTAETFAVALERWHTYSQLPGKPPEAWLFGIAKNLLRRYRRTRRVSTAALRRLGIAQRPAVTDDDIEAVEKLVDLDQLEDLVQASLGTLSAKTERAVRLRVMDQRPYSEVAAAIGCSVGAARVRVSRGIAALSKMPDLAAISESHKGEQP